VEALKVPQTPSNRVRKNEGSNQIEEGKGGRKDPTRRRGVLSVGLG